MTISPSSISVPVQYPTMTPSKISTVARSVADSEPESASATGLNTLELSVADKVPVSVRVLAPARVDDSVEAIVPVSLTGTNAALWVTASVAESVPVSLTFFSTRPEIATDDVSVIENVPVSAPGLSLNTEAPSVAESVPVSVLLDDTALVLVSMPMKIPESVTEALEAI